MQTCRHTCRHRHRDIQTFRFADIQKYVHTSSIHTDIQARRQRGIQTHTRTLPYMNVDIQRYRHTCMHAYIHADIQRHIHTDIQT